MVVFGGFFFMGCGVVEAVEDGSGGWMVSP